MRRNFLIGLAIVFVTAGSVGHAAPAAKPTDAAPAAAPDDLKHKKSRGAGATGFKRDGELL